MKNSLNLSVIVPTLNSEAFLSRALASIACQSVPILEVLIIDGGSSDLTLSIARNYNELPIQIRSEKDQGVYDAMNKGIAKSKGEIIAILNSDDEWIPDIIHHILNIFQNFPKIDVVHGNIEYVSVKSRKEIKPSKGILRKIGFGLPAVHPATFVRASVYSRLGCFDYSNFPVCADQAFIYRCLFNNVKFYHLNQIITIMHAGGVSSKHDYKLELIALFDLLPPAYSFLGKAAWHASKEDTSWFNGERVVDHRSVMSGFISKLIKK